MQADALISAKTGSSPGALCPEKPIKPELVRRFQQKNRPQLWFVLQGPVQARYIEPFSHRVGYELSPR
jgi:hypothetical protein